EQRTPEWLHVLGDASGQYRLTHMGKYPARLFAQLFLDEVALRAAADASQQQAPTTQVVFTDPQVAYVGHTEESARDAGYDVITGKPILLTSPVPRCYVMMWWAKQKLWWITPQTVSWVPRWLAPTPLKCCMLPPLRMPVTYRFLRCPLLFRSSRPAPSCVWRYLHRLPQ